MQHHLASTALFVLLVLPVPVGAQQSPPVPDHIVDLRTSAGADAVAARWSYAPATVVDSTFNTPGSTTPAPTLDIFPRIDSPDFSSASWEPVAPDALETRRTNGKFAFGWYRVDLKIPPTIEGAAIAGAEITFDITVDDYAEIWVDGKQAQVLGQRGGGVVGGWNAPQRVILDRDAVPGTSHQVAILAANAPLSRPPENYIWIRSATLGVYTERRDLRRGISGVTTTLVSAEPAFAGVIAPGTTAQRLATGFQFTEGPLWVPPIGADSAVSYGGGGRGGYLLFSDPNQNVIHRWEPIAGAVSIYRAPSGYSGSAGAPIGEYHQPGSNGLTLDPQGRLIICEHGNRRVTRLEPNGSLTVLADRFEGKRLNSPNDVVCRRDGVVLFTDPPFGLPRVYDDPRKELASSGVYAITEAGVRLLTDELKGPNGLALSPDEKTLYISNWDEQRKVILWADLSAGATLSNIGIFADLTSVGSDICLDGLKVDTSGNVYVSAPDGVRIYSSGGTHLGTLVLPELPANFAFGDADFKTLYLTARTGLYRIRTLVPGIGPRPALAEITR